MPEQYDYLKIRDIVGSRGIQALKELCKPAANSWDKDRDKLRDTAKCNPRTFDFPTGGAMEEAVLKSIFEETNVDIGIVIEKNGQNARYWDDFIREMGDDIDIYRNGVHNGLTTRIINGVQSRLSWHGRYNVLIVTFDITYLGAQVAGYHNGVIHQYSMCIQS